MHSLVPFPLSVKVGQRSYSTISLDVSLGSKADFRLRRVRPLWRRRRTARAFNLAFGEFGVNSSGLSLKLQAELEEKIHAIDTRTAALDEQAQRNNVL